MNNYLINCKRFWYPRGTNLAFSDNGYLPDPETFTGRIRNPEVVSFDSISQSNCLVLLGEPGMGKSTFLEHQQSVCENNDEIAIFLNLRSFQSDHRLINSLHDDERFKKWLEGTHTLHLFLDSLDEGLLSISVLASLLVDEITKLPTDRLCLRIACRTADWPTFLENGLVKIWSEEEVKRYVLAPLRRGDIQEAARITGIAENQFVEQIESKRVIPLAIKPVTLRFLLSIFKKSGHFPTSQTDLYQEGCLLLSKETSESREAANQTGDLTSDQRFAIAARLGATTIFGNRHAVFTGHNVVEAPEEDLLMRDCIGGTEGEAESSFPIGEVEVKEVLGSALFTTIGPNRMAWAHQTYAEYLAASYLIRHKFSSKQMIDLIVHPEDPNRKIVPQLAETAAWLSTMNSDIRQTILKIEPEILLRSEVTLSDNYHRKELVRALLSLYEEEKLFDRDETQLKKLSHPELGNQILPYILNKNMGHWVRRVAINIAVACNLQDLSETFIEVALDPLESQAIREAAAYAVSQIGKTNTKSKLKPLLNEGQDSDPDDQLKAYALRVLWPDHISTDELFSFITPPKRDHYVGTYSVFLAELSEQLPPGELPIALQFFSISSQPRDAMPSALESLMDRVIRKSWDNLDYPEIAASLASLLVARSEFYDGTITGYQDVSSRSLFSQNEDKRRKLAKAVFMRMADNPDGEVFWLLHSATPLITTNDLEWLLFELDSTTEGDLQNILISVLKLLFDGTKPAHLELIDTASQSNFLVQDAFKWVWEPIGLHSEEANKMKAHHQKMAKFTKKRERPLLDPPPAERVTALLEECEQHDSNAWWRLNLELTLEPTSTHYGTPIEWDLTKLPGWISANQATKNRIIQTGMKYLLEQNPHAQQWLGTNQIYHPAFAGYRALALLLRTAPSLLSTMPHQMWCIWSSIILGFPLQSTDEDQRVNQELLRLAWPHASLSLLNVLGILIDKENLEGNRISIATRINVVWDNQVAALLLGKAKSGILNHEGLASVLSILLAHEDHAARAYAETLVPSPLPTDARMRDRAVVIAQTLFTDTHDAGWTTIWPTIAQNVEFGKKVITGVAQDNPSIGLRLNPDQLANLYLWLTQNFPEPAQQAGTDWMDSVDHIDMWRNSIINILRARGTYQACEAIKKLQQELVEKVWLKNVLAEAQSLTRRTTWVPLQSQDILKLAKDHELRFVQNGDQLLELLIESMNRLQVKIQGETYAAQFLWDNVNGSPKKPKKEIASPTKPKDENALCDFIKLHLDEEFKRKGIIVNREVQIHRLERTDIHVDAVVEESSGLGYGSVCVIIETKGCWNRGIDKAIEEQLVGKYLRNNQCQHGLFLVGWFNCEKWDRKDYRKGEGTRLCRNREETEVRLKAQAHNASVNGVKVQAVVLDTSLRE